MRILAPMTRSRIGLLLSSLVLTGFVAGPASAEPSARLTAFFDDGSQVRLALDTVGGIGCVARDSGRGPAGFETPRVGEHELVLLVFADGKPFLAVSAAVDGTKISGIAVRTETGETGGVTGDAESDFYFDTTCPGCYDAGHHPFMWSSGIIVEYPEDIPPAESAADRQVNALEYRLALLEAALAEADALGETNLGGGDADDETADPRDPADDRDERMGECTPMGVIAR